MFKLLSSLLIAAGQILCTLGTASSPYNAYSDQRPTGDAMQLAGQVNGALVSVCRPNCPGIAMFRNPTVANVIVTSESPGQAKIVYNPQFFTTVYETFGDGGILALLAHEVGHVIDPAAPVSWMKASWSSELRADAWTGCALAKMSLSGTALRASVRTLAKYPSPSHPGWTMRVPALRLGYTQCGGDGTKFDVVIQG